MASNMTKETDGKCVVCGSKIVEEFEERFIGTGSLPMDGVSDKKQYRKVSVGFYCSNNECGLRYAFVPKPRRSRMGSAMAPH